MAFAHLCSNYKNNFEFANNKFFEKNFAKISINKIEIIQSKKLINIFILNK